MVGSKLIWKHVEDGRSDLIGEINNIVLFGTASFKTKNNEHNWTLICNLPGIKKELGEFKTKSEAQTKAHNALEYWMNKIGFKFDTER